MESEKQIGLTDRVPRALRGKLPGYKLLLPTYLGDRLSTLNVDQALPYISGAMRHQEYLLDSASKPFYGQLDRIEIVDRVTKVRGDLVGRKAILWIKTEDRDGRLQDEDITTPWIEYYGNDLVSAVWEVALGQTILSAAQKLLGQRVAILKAFEEEREGSRFSSGRRWVADLWSVDADQTHAKETKEAGPTVAQATAERVRTIIKRDGLCTDLNAKEIEAVAKAIDSEAAFGSIIDAVAETMGLDPEELNALTPDPTGDHVLAVLQGLDKALAS